MDGYQLPDYHSFSVGGGRLATIILYLSENTIGGKTIFPSVDVGVVPEAGSVLLFATQEIVYYNKLYHSHIACNSVDVNCHLFPQDSIGPHCYP